MDIADLSEIFILMKFNITNIPYILLCKFYRTQKNPNWRHCNALMRQETIARQHMLKCRNISQPKLEHHSGRGWGQGL